MSRKDYIIIAAALAATRPVEDDRGYDEDENTAHMTQWTDDRDSIARALADQSGYDLNGNRRFDMDRFVKATEK